MSQKYGKLEKLGSIDIRNDWIEARFRKEKAAHERPYPFICLPSPFWPSFLPSALTFASIELPRLLDTLIIQNVDTPDVATARRAERL